MFNIWKKFKKSIDDGAYAERRCNECVPSVQQREQEVLLQISQMRDRIDSLEKSNEELEDCIRIITDAIHAMDIRRITNTYEKMKLFSRPEE